MHLHKDVSAQSCKPTKLVKDTVITSRTREVHRVSPPSLVDEVDQDVAHVARGRTEPNGVAGAKVPSSNRSGRSGFPRAHSISIDPGKNHSVHVNAQDRLQFTQHNIRGKKNINIILKKTVTPRLSANQDLDSGVVVGSNRRPTNVTSWPLE
jgi:hypothetical protein